MRLDLLDLSRTCGEIQTVTPHPRSMAIVVVLGMRLGNLSLTCLIRQNSDCHSAPPGKMD